MKGREVLDTHECVTREERGKCDEQKGAFLKLNFGTWPSEVKQISGKKKKNERKKESELKKTSLCSSAPQSWPLTH